jgi:hypothetical protein
MIRDPTWVQTHRPCARVHVRSRKPASGSARWGHGGFSRGRSRFSPTRSAEAHDRARPSDGAPPRPSLGPQTSRWLEQATVPGAVGRTEEICPCGWLKRYSSRSSSRSKPQSRRCASSFGQSSSAPSRSRCEAGIGSRVRRQFAACAMPAGRWRARAMPASVWTAAGDDRAR